jgi:hypothetical protein
MLTDRPPPPAAPGAGGDGAPSGGRRATARHHHRRRQAPLAGTHRTNGRWLRTPAREGRPPSPDDSRRERGARPDPAWGSPNPVKGMPDPAPGGRRRRTAEQHPQPWFLRLGKQGEGRKRGGKLSWLRLSRWPPPPPGRSPAAAVSATGGGLGWRMGGCTESPPEPPGRATRGKRREPNSDST